MDAAARMFGRDGFQGASMGAVAEEAGVSKGLLHYHFESKEHLLIEAVRATFRQLHRRFDDRFRQGDRGLDTALEGLDALWAAVRDMHAWAPFLVEIMTFATKPGPLRDDLFAFYAESEALLVKGIGDVFHPSARPAAVLEESHDSEPVVPAERLARLVRIGLHGLVVELAYARTAEERAAVEASYQDLRELFRRVSEQPHPSAVLEPSNPASRT